MRTILDGEERVEVTEVTGIGCGARRLGSAFPWPTEAALSFKRDGKAPVSRSAVPGALGMTDAELLAVLHSEPNR